MDLGRTGKEIDHLSPAEVGLPREDYPFSLIAAEEPSPLVISYPHAGLDWSDDFGPEPQINFKRNADFGVRDLFALAPCPVATHVVARFSRVALDLNRAEDDLDPNLVPEHPNPKPRLHPSGITGAPLVSVNRGILWGRAHGDIQIIKSLALNQFEKRLDRIHRPYYRALRTLLERRRNLFGFAVLLDAHTMTGTVLPDLVLGTLGGQSCSIDLRKRSKDVLGGKDPIVNGLSFSADSPYWGGNIIRTFGQPDQGFHALQLEVNSRLFLAKNRLELSLQEADRAQNGNFHYSGLLQRLNALQRVLAVPKKSKSFR